jgi:hypothetical protein
MNLEPMSAPASKANMQKWGVMIYQRMSGDASGTHGDHIPEFTFQVG